MTKHARRCKFCNSFMTGRPNKKFCSANCKLRNHRAKRKAT